MGAISQKSVNERNVFITPKRMNGTKEWRTVDETNVIDMLLDLWWYNE